jgi:hypothetical protein
LITVAALLEKCAGTGYFIAGSARGGMDQCSIGRREFVGSIEYLLIVPRNLHFYRLAVNSRRAGSPSAAGRGRYAHKQYHRFWG